MIIVIKTKNIVITIFIFTCIFRRGNNDKKLIINSLFKTSIYIFFLTAIRHTDSPTFASSVPPNKFKNLVTMKRNLLFIILLLLLPGLHQVFAASTIKKVAPTFWWAGMKNPELQILL